MHRSQPTQGTAAVSGETPLLAHLIATWLVAAAWRVPPGDLTGSRGGPHRIAAAKHVAIYLVHVVFGIRQDVTARLFGQNRRTVARACAHIEDLRDAAAADREIGQLEQAALALARQLSLEVCRIEVGSVEVSGIEVAALLAVPAKGVAA